MEALKIENLFFKYDKKSSIYNIDDISLNIEEGEYLTIIGHNGSGKSTLAKLIIGLLEAEKGDIYIFNTLLNEENLSVIRNKVGIVFQNPDNQFIGATVRDDIAFGLENHNVPHEEMDDIINKFSKIVSMEEFLDKEPVALSGGQKQRVAIAGVLAMNPNIIILDEATAMLDPRGKKEIIDLIHMLRKENPSLTIISITHDLEEAYNSTRTIVLNKGKIVFNGKPEEVFSHYEELVNQGLDLPFFPKLKYKLKEIGIDAEDASCLDEVVNRICQ